MKFDSSNKFDLYYYGQINSPRLKSSVPNTFGVNIYFAGDGIYTLFDIVRNISVAQIFARHNFLKLSITRNIKVFFSPLGEVAPGTETDIFGFVTYKKNFKKS